MPNQKDGVLRVRVVHRMPGEDSNVLKPVGWDVLSQFGAHHVCQCIMPGRLEKW